MLDHAALEEMQKVLDEVFRDRERATRREVYASASAHVRLPADMLTHLNEMPDRSYSRQEMVDAINKVIESRGEQDALGLL
ncbi:hypothetical protein [Microtetraspora sp. NBRC 16547]|uniref:hypothetical protein n=1 Tax=Microtetraspora sp. NBRC 16547 TaxID=3030993 RepID=UPI00249FB843|nr:hypothetical protein [Microtetraspora sp. NBRC 16547]GLX01411.1 hypothetical protein Misp02_54970 [Microtetraspora sp. NBRC 16547]